MTSSTSSSDLPRVAALLGPLLLVGAALGWWGRPNSEAETVSSEVLACRDRLEQGGAEVVVVGNSKSGTDIDRAVLGRALGTPRVAQVGGPGSSAPHWYAALGSCVYGPGHRPRLILIYGTLGAMLRVEMRSEIDRARLFAWLGGEEPILDQKVFGVEAANPFWRRVRTRKSAVAVRVQHGVRDLVAGVFFAPPGEGGLLEDGEAFAEPALAKVFGAEASHDLAARARVIPIAARETHEEEVKERSVADTLLLDLVRLAQDQGSRIVFVRAPIADWKYGYDAVSDAQVRGTVEALNAVGAGYVDLSDLGLPASAFGDGVHMNAVGRAGLTAALAERLVALDALGTEPLGPAALPRPAATGSRSGSPPALSIAAPIRTKGECGWLIKLGDLAGVSDATLGRLGLGAASPLLLLEDGRPLRPHARPADFDQACNGAFSHQGGGLKFSPSGGPVEVASSRSYALALSAEAPMQDGGGADAWWVYPGTTLRLDLAEGWVGDPDRLRLHVEGHAAIPGNSPASVRVSGGPSALLEEDGSTRRASLEIAAPRGPWSVEIVSPADGPWLLLRKVVLGTDASPWFIVGRPATSVSVDLLAGPATWSTEPPAVAAPGRITAGTGKAWKAKMEGIEVPDQDLVFQTAGVPACSMLRLAEDGAPLPLPNRPAGEVSELGQGRYAHKARGLFFSTSDGSSPLDNGRAYTLRLDPGRACGRGRWLYPGDHGRFTVDEKALSALNQAASELQLVFTSFARHGETAPLSLRLDLGGEPFLEASQPVAGLGQQTASFPLSRPIARDEVGLSFELSTPPEAPYLLVTSAALVEPAAADLPAPSP